MKLVLTLFLILSTVTTGLSQVVFDLEEKDKKELKSRSTVRFYTAFGPANPSQVNTYIKSYIQDKLGSGPYYSMGSSNISSVGLLGLAVGIPVHESIKPQIAIEYAGASREVSINNDQERFSINRFSIGALVDYYFPSEKNSTFFVGGGALYNSTTFKSYAARGIGSRIHFGYTIFRPAVAWEFFMGIDLPAKDVSKSSSEISTIDLTAPLFGVRLAL
jgi:hypothetical protein